MENPRKIEFLITRHLLSRKLQLSVGGKLLLTMP